MAVLMLAIMLIVRRKDFSVKKGELKVLGSLGMLFAASSITYYQSFHFMDAGIASTILFVYPVMVAVIMATFSRSMYY
jgi:drug/metabolite transporter (DMT)-like permease